MSNDTHKDKKQRVCSKHLLSFWGDDQYGNPYPRCAAGHRLNEDCRELVEDPHISER